ncbi:MAG: hypothetical protein FWC27_11910 [Firmicutes bacterium]|nr:hypothetical protein [Bacillota bacterium]
MVKIIEQYLQSKTGHMDTCEDGVFVSGNYIAVIDGVTAKGKLLWEGKKSGRHARDVLLTSLENAAADFTAVECIEFLNASLTAAYGALLEYAASHPTDRLQAGVILYSIARQEIWSFGDCQCILNGALHDHAKKVDTINSEKRSAFLAQEVLAGKTEEELMAHDTGRERILPELENQMQYANADGELGYDVLDGIFIRPERTIVYPVPKGSVVVLASDGYPFLKTTLAESETELALLLKTDRLLYRNYKSTKGLVKDAISYDDRAYIRFLVD